MIEGNRLTQVQVGRVIEQQEHFPGRERDEKEVLGYYAAIELLESYVEANALVTENQIQRLHALVVSGGRKRVKASVYRDGQNVIRDSATGGIVYMPPEVQDVKPLMEDLIDWINGSIKHELPCPIRASIAHYQFATIHPYYDGNGRTARLLTTLILQLGGFGLKGLYSLEEYYARDLNAYYKALSLGPSHNYYLGRADADVTPFVEYFCEGMAYSFERVQSQTRIAASQNGKDQAELLRLLDPRQRKSLLLFRKSHYVTSNEVAKLFSISVRMARNLLVDWVESGFVQVYDPSKRARKYVLHPDYRMLVKR
jgi:Fic family protein